MTGTAHGILNDQYGRFHLETWIDAEGMAFRDSFVRVIMRYWDAKFELTPNQPWYRPSGRRTLRVTLEQREDLMGLGDDATAREAQPWKSQLRHHLTPERSNRVDAALRFTAYVAAP